MKNDPRLERHTALNWQPMKIITASNRKKMA